MTSCGRKRLQWLYMPQKPAKRDQKLLVWTKNSLFIVYQSYIYCAVTNAEIAESFGEILLELGEPNCPFQLRNCFGNRFQDQKDRYFVPVIGFFLYEPPKIENMLIKQKYTSKICTSSKMHFSKPVYEQCCHFT